MKRLRQWRLKRATRMLDTEDSKVMGQHAWMLNGFDGTCSVWFGQKTGVLRVSMGSGERDAQLVTLTRRLTPKQAQDLRYSLDQYLDSKGGPT